MGAPAGHKRRRTQRLRRRKSLASGVVSLACRTHQDCLCEELGSVRIWAEELRA